MIEHVPTLTKVNTLPAKLQILGGLSFENVTGLPDPPPVAVSVTAAAPMATGDAGAKPVIVCGNSATALITMLALACGAAE